MYGGINVIKALFVVIVIILAGTIVYFLFQDREPPSIDIIEKTEENGKLLLKVRIRDTSRIARAYVLVEYPSGNTFNVILSPQDDIYSLSFPIDLSEEGTYLIQIFARDIRGNLGSAKTRFDFYDNPRITCVFEYTPSLLKFNVTADDTSGISKVLLEVFNKNYTLPPIKVDFRGNGLYGGEIPILVSSAENITYRVFAFDKFNRVSVFKDYIPLILKDLRPPEIIDLAWKPTRIVNGKVYDGIVSFTAEDSSSIIKKASLVFAPINYSHLNPVVFPNETARRFDLTPLDGTFNSTRESFAVNITNIVGGREYLIICIVEDDAGNIATANITTPYIREFEKIVSDYLLGVGYMTFWDIYWKYSPAGRWKEVGVVYEPLLGQYKSSDRTVVNKHIDWATGHGIGFFCLDFGWIRPNSPFDNIARNYLLKSDLIDSINFTIFYYNDAVVGESWSKGRSALFSDFSFLAMHYFSHSSYLKVDGKPIIYILNLPIYWREFGIKETNNLFKDLKEYMKNKYGFELFLVVDVWPNVDPSLLDDPNLPFDGIVNWGNLWHNVGAIEIEYDHYADKYAEYWEKWYSLAKKRGLQFIPLIYPGFDDKPYADYYGRAHHCIGRNPEKFCQLLYIAKKYTTSLKTIILFTWNDFHEGTSIEPTREYGFTYLDIIRRVFEMDE